MAVPSVTEKTLQEELQYAIRHDHLILNRLITSRMPLCLPPKTDNPLRFALGLTVFAHLYTSFESAWDSMVSQAASKPPAYLVDLQTLGLSRHIRLSSDLHSLSTVLGPKSAKRMKKLDGETKYIQKNIIDLCQDKPHLILAWAWTMYLAIFNGGRYIRAALEQAGDDFWGTKTYPLAFWNFEGKDDGDQIHDDFKDNFDDAAKRLTREQKDEVIAEAKRIFHVCEDVVHVLDMKVGQDEAMVVISSLVCAANPLSVLRAVFALFSRGWRSFAGLWRAWRTPVALPADQSVIEKA